ncbi:hypothetical protein D046_2636A, partial [Vibrio parahaemolyticus V-223/04]
MEKLALQLVFGLVRSV